MVHKVSLTSCGSYHPDEVDAAVRRSVALLGGISAFVSPGQKVCLKPNLLMAASPERAITTHPAIVEAVARLVLEGGALPFIADSPGGGTPHTEKALLRLYAETGMLDLARRLGIPLNYDTGFAELSHPDAKVARRIEIMRPLVEADAIIALPKLKTHVYTRLSGATKVMFGAVPGLAKPGYHAKLDSLRRFSDMLLDVLALLKPCLFVMDAVVGMEGDGPGTHGLPRRIGAVLGGRSAVAVDAVACELVGIAPTTIPILSAAAERGLWQAAPSAITVVGDSLESMRIRDFVLPATATDPAGLIQMSLPQRLVRPLVRAGLTLRPVPRKGICVGCGTCARACPKGAVSISRRVARIDDRLCIRCYCCHESCPVAAIELRSSLLGRLARKTGAFGKPAGGRPGK